MSLQSKNGVETRPLQIVVLIGNDSQLSCFNTPRLFTVVGGNGLRQWRRMPAGRMLYLLEKALYILMQSRLIVFDKPEVVATLGQDGHRYLALGKHRITTDNPSLQVELA